MQVVKVMKLTAQHNLTWECGFTKVNWMSFFNTYSSFDIQLEMEKIKSHGLPC